MHPDEGASFIVCQVILEPDILKSKKRFFLKSNIRKILGRVGQDRGFL